MQLKCKLTCRKFKFPLKSSSSSEFPASPVEEETISPRTPVSETVPADPPSGISSVLTEEPSTTEPGNIEESVEQSAAVMEEASPVADTDGPPPIDESTTENEPANSAQADVISTSITEPTPEAPQADIEIPNTSLSEAQPIIISSPKNPPEQTHGHVATSIDEAIADFKTAIKTPEPESVKAPETLSAIEIDATLAPAENIAHSEQTVPVGDVQEGVKPPVNGHKPLETASANGLEGVSPTAPRSITTTPVSTAEKATSPSQSEQGEGTTMEDIDID